MSKKVSIDIGLSALVKHAGPEQTILRKDIAEVCECSIAAIRKIEDRAMSKIKKNRLARQLHNEM